MPPPVSLCDLFDHGLFCYTGCRARPRRTSPPSLGWIQPMLRAPLPWVPARAVVAPVVAVLVVPLHRVPAAELAQHPLKARQREWMEKVRVIRSLARWALCGYSLLVCHTFILLVINYKQWNHLYTIIYTLWNPTPMTCKILSSVSVVWNTQKLSSIELNSSEARGLWNRG